MTETVDEQAMLDAILERAADELGDITPLVLDRFYARFPEAKARFEALWPGNAAALEGDMVERALYCIMMWTQSRSEIEIMLRESVPHHASTLDVPVAWFDAFLSAAVDIIGEVAQSHERAFWNRLGIELLGLVHAGARG